MTRAAATLILTLLVLLTRAFEFPDTRRVQMIDAPIDARPSLTLATSETLPVRELALTFRAAAIDADALPLRVSVDGRSACSVRVSRTPSRFDCSVVVDQADLTHEVSMASSGGAWRLHRAELSTHFGNSNGFLRLLIVPSVRSLATVGPLRVLLALAGLAVLFLVPSTPWPRAVRRVDVGLAAVTACMGVALLVAPVVSQYLVAASFGTVVRLASIASATKFLDLAAWLWRTGSAHRRDVVARAAVVGVLALAVFVTRPLVELRDEFGGNWSGFVKIDRPFAEKNPVLLSDPSVLPSLKMYDIGYDGQLMYFQAFDPLMITFHQTPERYFDVVGGAPAYRYGRIGYSWLTWMASLGRWQWFPTAMTWLAVAAVAVCAFILAVVAQQQGQTALTGLVMCLVPGFWVSAHRALPEPLAAAFQLMALFLAWRGHLWAAAASAAFALLTRETSAPLLVPLALIVWSRRRSVRDVAIVVGLTLMPVALWRMHVGMTMWPVQGLEAFMPSAPTGLPFVGIARLWTHIANGDFWVHVPRMSVAGIAYPFIVFAAAVVAVMAFWVDIGLGIWGSVYALNAVSLNYESVWGDLSSAERTSFEVFVVAAVVTASSRHVPARGRWVIAACWIAAAIYMGAWTLDAEQLRRVFVDQWLTS